MDPRILDVLRLGARGVAARRRPRARAARPRRADGPLRPRPPRAQGRAVRPGHPPAAVARARRPRACSRRCARATCWCTTRTTRSPPACSGSSSRRPPIRTCWRSSRRCTGPPATPPSSTRSSRRPRPASRSSSWWRSRPGSTRRPTSAGPARWSGPAATSSTAWSASRPTARRRWSCAASSGVIRRYCHIGTGNYNPKTARIYEDLGILTADPRVGADLTDLFNTLTGYSRQTNYRTLMVAPHGVRTGLVEKIRREARHAGEGRPAGIRIKVNSIVDEKIIDALYEASRGRRAGGAVRSAASARCAPASRACRRTSGCARSSAASSSTRGSCTSATAARASGGSAAPTSCTATSTAAWRCCCGSATSRRAPAAASTLRPRDGARRPLLGARAATAAGAAPRAGTTRPSSWTRIA